MPPTRCHPEPDAYICEARIRDRHVTFNYCKRRPNWPPFYCSLNVVGDFFCGVSAILRFLQLPFGLVPELLVPSIWPVALFPQFVSTLSDLIFCWLIHCVLPPSTACPSPGGLVGGERARLCRPQLWVRPDKPIRASYACSQKKNPLGAAGTKRVLA